MFDQRGSRKYLNDAERLAFFVATRNEKNAGRKAFCQTLFYTGCRISEALNLTGERIDLSQKCVVFETLKQRRRGLFRSVPVPDNVTLLLGDLLAGVETSTKIWKFSRPTAFRMIKGYMMQAGLDGVMASPKGLRHGFAVACVAKGIPLTTIQKWLGHARLETTAIYLAVSGDEERSLASRLWS